MMMIAAVLVAMPLVAYQLRQEFMRVVDGGLAAMRVARVERVDEVEAEVNWNVRVEEQRQLGEPSGTRVALPPRNHRRSPLSETEARTNTRVSRVTQQARGETRFLPGAGRRPATF